MSFCQVNKSSSCGSVAPVHARWYSDKRSPAALCACGASVLHVWLWMLKCVAAESPKALPTSSDGRNPPYLNLNYYTHFLVACIKTLTHKH